MLFSHTGCTVFVLESQNPVTRSLEKKIASKVAIRNWAFNMWKNYLKIRTRERYMSVPSSMNNYSQMRRSDTKLELKIEKKIIDFSFLRCISLKMKRLSLIRERTVKKKRFSKYQRTHMFDLSSEILLMEGSDKMSKKCNKRDTKMVIFLKEMPPS